MYWQKRGSKYSAKRFTYNGHTCQSAKKAAYALQVPIDLKSMATDCTYTIDFLEIRNGGEVDRDQAPYSDTASVRK